MSEAIKALLKSYKCVTAIETKNALKEIIQEIALVGLWRSKFFEHAAFYGGTSLRILYGLDRFSEDLDFSLLKPDASFNLDHYTQFILEELESYGFKTSLSRKEKMVESAIQSAFIKAGSLEQILTIQAHPEEVLKVRIEVDTNPPPYFKTESKFILRPSPVAVNTFVPQDLFAGKMHAILCRQWKARVKGRDWYDLVWFLSKNISLNLHHLESRMKQSGHFSENEKLDEKKFRDLYQDKVRKLNFENAKDDIRPFIKDHSKLTLWSPEFFEEMGNRIVIV